MTWWRRWRCWGHPVTHCVLSLRNLEAHNAKENGCQLKAFDRSPARWSDLAKEATSSMKFFSALRTTINRNCWDRLTAANHTTTFLSNEKLQENIHNNRVAAQYTITHAIEILHSTVTPWIVVTYIKYFIIIYFVGTFYRTFCALSVCIYDCFTWKRTWDGDRSQ